MTELPKPLCPCRRAVPFMVDGIIQTLRGGLLAKLEVKQTDRYSIYLSFEC